MLRSSSKLHADPAWIHRSQTQCSPSSGSCSTLKVLANFPATWGSEHLRTIGHLKCLCPYQKHCWSFLDFFWGIPLQTSPLPPPLLKGTTAASLRSTIACCDLWWSDLVKCLFPVWWKEFLSVLDCLEGPPETIHLIPVASFPFVFPGRRGETSKLVCNTCELQELNGTLSQ